MNSFVRASLTVLLLSTSSAGARQQPPTPAAKPAGGRACEADFERVEATVRENYAGFRDKTAGREAELAAFTERGRAEARAAADRAACTEALRRWTGFFRDKHLAVSETQAGPAASPAAKPTPDTNAEKPPAAAPAADPDRPALRFVDDDAAVLRLPSFGSRYQPAVDKLIEEHRARLLATPFLVIDVRGNGGGWTEVYRSVIPLLYTDPIFQDGMDAWASPGNVAAVRELIASPRAPEAMKAQARGLLARMEAAPGQFVTFAEDAELRLDAVHPLPRAVAVLVDRRCASTCEQFVLDARQSRKVKVLGAANTGGLLDYGNARTVGLPSGQRRLHVPFTRSRRLPAGPMDLVGIMPDVRVRRDEADPVAFALRYLRAAPEKGK